MTRSLFPLGSTAIAVSLTAQTAMADVTPGDVWQDWRDYFQGMGYAVTATEIQAGDTLTLSDAQFNLAADDQDGDVRMTLEALNLVQNDDGTVSVIMPVIMPVLLEVITVAPEAQSVRMALTLNQTGQDMTVSGTPSAMTSNYQADMTSIKLDQLTVDDQSYAADTAMFDLALMEVMAQSESTIGQMRDYVQTASIASATYDMRFKDPEEPAIAIINGTSTDLSFEGSGQLPLGLAQVGDMTGMLRAGMNAAGTIDAGASTLTVDIEDPRNGDSAAAFATETSVLTIETNADGLTYAGTRDGMTISVQPPEFPFLLSAALDTAAFNLSAPVLKSDEPQDFALGLTLNGLTFSDMVWGLINPQNTLPRDPATVVLDVTGRATLLDDFLASGSAETLAENGALPGQLENVSLNALIVDALGARLTGNGSASFDNADAASPMQPTGVVDLRLEGGNTLIDTLVTSGLVPQQMAMGAPMMIGMFAKPGDGPDTLTSRLEFTRSGNILANGQRIK